MRTIAQISDLHFGRHSTSTAEDLLTSVNENQPDLVVVSGDFTQRARHAEFEQARRFLNRIPHPKLVVPGNHDIPLYNVLTRFMTPFASYRHYVSPLGLPAEFFGDEEIAVLGLNTARRFTRKNGRVSIEQIRQIGRVFNKVPPGIFKALVTHHPLGFPSEEATLRLAGRSSLALETIAAAGVHLLLSGHYHRALSGHPEAETSCKNSVLLLHAGTAISTRTRGGDGNSYNLVRIAANRVCIAVMVWSAGDGFRETRARSYVLANGRWQAA